MRLGIVSYDFDPPIGGLGIVMKHLVDEFKRVSPHDVFVTVSPSELATDRVSRIATSRFRKSGGCPIFSLCLFFVLPAVIRRHSLDILHVHAGSGGVFLLRKPSIPVVVTAHHTYKQEVDVVYVRQPIRRLWKLCMSFLERRTYRIADAITCVSEDTAQALVKDYGIPQSKITVIENGVDEIFFSSPDLPREQNRILFVGRLEARKGICSLLSAFRLVLDTVPSARLELIGSNLIGESLVDYINAHSLASSVNLRGYVDESSRITSMSSATLIVVPSLLEGFGLISAEAMALGCPVVSSSAPGLRSLITQNITGVLVPVCDDQALAEAITRVLLDRELQSTLGNNARDTARVRFRWSRAGESLFEVFRSLMRTNNVYKN